MSTLGTAYVQILPSTEGIQNNLTEALSGASSTAGKESGQSFAASMASGLATGAVALTGAATAVVSGVVATASATAAAGDAIDKTSQKLGVSAEQYQTMAFAAEHCGFEVSTFQTAARNLANTDFEGNISDAITAIQGIEDPALRAATAEELLGTRAAQQMAALINGEMSMEDYKTTLEELGGMMSDDAVKNSAAFADAMTDMKAATSGLTASLAGQFLPQMTNVIDGVAMLVSGNMDGLDLIESGVTDFLGGISGAIPELFTIGGELLNSLLNAIMSNLPQLLTIGVEAISNFANGISENLPALIPQAIELVITLATALIENLPLLISAGGQLIVGVATGLLNSVPTVVAAIPGLISTMYDAFVEGVATISDVGMQIVTGIWDGISSGYDWIAGQISTWCDSVIDWFKSVLKIGSPSRLFADEVGIYMAQGIGMGFESEMRDVNKNMQNALPTDFALDAETATATGHVINQITFNAKELTEADIDMVIMKANRMLGGFA